MHMRITNIGNRLVNWNNLLAIVISLPRSSPRWRLLFVRKKRRNLYLLPSYSLRLLALPYLCRTATQKPTPVYAIIASGYISHEILCQKQDNYISTGIYRCSILDIDKKFARHFKESRISADKRFLMYFHCIPLRLTPDLGFCEAICNCKIIKNF